MYTILRPFVHLVFPVIVGPLLASGIYAAPLPTGQINGSILDSSKKAVNHAFVTALIQSGASTTKPFSTTVVTGVNGAFALTGIPDGAFTICVQVPGANYLDPCQWSATPPTVTIKNGQTVSAPAIQLVVGYRYQVRFNDPTSAIVQNEATRSGAQLLMYVWAKGISTPLLWGADDASGRVYQALVPFGTALRFTLQGQKYQVVDQSGVAVNLAAGVTTSINVTASALPSVVVTTTGAPDLTYRIVKVSP